MGKKTREKLLKTEEYENKYKKFLTISSMNLAQKKKENIELNTLNFLKEIIEEYKSSFIKDIDNFKFKTKSKDEEKQLLELVRYAFNKFTVPSFMYRAWELSYSINKENIKILKEKTNYKDWYVCIATGGSLYKSYFKNFFTKKETHIFLTCKYDLSINQALVYSVAKAEYNNEGIALRIARSKLSRKVITNKFWKNSIRFFAKNTPKSINEIDDLVDFLSAKYRENRKYSILGQGYTLNSLNKKMNDWHYDLRRLKNIGNASWKGAELDDSEYIKKDEYGNEIIWKFTQIKTAKELQLEGNKQRHCVFSYKDSCIKGYCSIWSLSTIDHLGITSKKLTIELSSGLSISQARGVANRSPKPQEQAILEKWAFDNGLSYRSYKYRF